VNPIEIPVLNQLLLLFKRLRRYGFPLGIEDYMLALQALQAGFGIGDRQVLEKLCCTLWAKSEEDTRLIHQLLNEILKKPDVYRKASSSSSIPQPVEEASNLSLSQTSSEPISEPSSPVDIFPDTEPEQVIQAIRSSQPHSLEISYYQESEDQYLPVTGRQMKQSWRFLRRLVREGKLEELDVTGTVDKICQKGILLEPVLMPRYSNRAELVLLVDQGGSMVPFHHLSRQLIDRARRGGNIKQLKVYYFYNYPEKYLYSDPMRLKAQPVTEVLTSIGKKAGVLIVSDAGAARGNYNPERVKYTHYFLDRLVQSVRYYAWLNPIPEDSWQDTTAGDIARSVLMFEMSREGLNAAINTLRGRYVYWERPYQ